MSGRNPRHYRIVPASLYEEDAAMAEQLADVLRSAGWPKATRSLIIREGLARLREDLAGKTAEEIFRYFVDRHAPRARLKPPELETSPDPARDKEK